MAKTFPNSITVIKYLSLLALVTSSLTPTSVGANELSYEEALKALNQTKEHTNKATGWGERRTVPVPKGVDPNTVINKEAIRVPSVKGIDSPTTTVNAEPIRVTVPINPQASAPVPSAAPTPTAAKPEAVTAPAQTNQSNQSNQTGGWDWLSSNDTVQKKTPSSNQGGVMSVSSTRPVASPPVSKAQTFTKATQSSMKTVYQAPVTTAAPAKKAAPLAVEKQNDDLLSLDEKEPVKTAQANSENAPVPTTSQSEKQAPAEKKIDKQEAAEFFAKAVKNHLSGKLAEAISDYNLAIQANPELGQAHCNLGMIYNQQHNYASALSEFRKALAIDPKDAFTYNGIGAAYRAQNDYDAALKNWLTATSLKPDLATAHYNLGTVYELKKDYDKAMLAYKDAIKNDKRLGEAYFRTGLILVRKNRLTEAKEQFQKSLDISDKAEYSEAARKKIAIIEQKGM